MTHALLTHLYPAAPPSALPGLSVGPGDAVLAWVHCVAEPLERGISHVLSNRAAALDATVEVLRGEADPALRDAGFADLRTEVERLFELNAILRLLPADLSTEEGFDLEETAQAAAQALSCHMEFRHGRDPVDIAGTAPPVRSVRWALFRATVALADGVRRLGGTGGIHLRLGGDADHATLAIGATQPPPPDRITLHEAGVPYACYLVAALGGTVHATGDGFVLELPSLTARRALDAGTSSAPPAG